MANGFPPRAAWRGTARDVGLALGGLAFGLALGAGALLATGGDDVGSTLPLEVVAAVALEPGGSAMRAPADPGPIDSGLLDSGPIDPGSVDQSGVRRAKVWACSGRSFGTAFVTDRGVLTAAHVIEGAAVVTLDDGPSPFDPEAAVLDPPETEIGTAAVLERARVTDGLDAALLAAAPTSAAHAVYPVREIEPLVGESVALVGHPSGGRREVRIGSIVGYGDGAVFGVAADRIMIVSVAADPGFSGGPVLDASGNAVAIIIGVETNTQTAVAVPLADVFEGLAAAEPVPAVRCDTP